MRRVRLIMIHLDSAALVQTYPLPRILHQAYIIPLSTPLLYLHRQSRMHPSDKHLHPHVRLHTGTAASGVVRRNCQGPDVAGVRATLAVTQVPTATRSRMTKPSWTILLVDEAPEERAVYRRYLQHDPVAEYRLWEAERGDHALILCQTRQPDCIVLDYRLPDFDGLTWLAHLQAQAGALAPPADPADRRGQRSTRSHGHAAGGPGLPRQGTPLARDALSGRAACY